MGSLGDGGGYERPHRTVMILRHRGGDGRYEALKKALIESFGKSVPAKQAQLVGLCANPSLGDRKPIEYLRHIQSLSGSDYKAVERAIFLHGMPTVVRTALADSHATSNEDLALRAGVILEEYQLSRPSGTPAVCGINSPSPVASSPDIGVPGFPNSGCSPSTSFTGPSVHERWFTWECACSVLVILVCDI